MRSPVPDAVASVPRRGRSAPVATRLAWRYLRGRGLRSLLTTLAVAFGVMLIFGLNGVAPTLEQAFTRSMRAASGKIDLTVTSAYHQPFGRDTADKVARVEGVGVASPGVQRSVPLPARSGVAAADQVTQVQVVGLDVPTATRIRDFTVARGRALAASDAEAIIMSADLAERLGLTVGDKLSLPSSVGSTAFTLVGTLASANAPGETPVYVPLAAAQRLFALGDRITIVEADLAPGANRAQVEDGVRITLGSDYTVGGLSSNASLLASLQVSTFAFTMFGVFALATAGFIILNSFRTVVAERRRDIGMLRAIGTPRRTIERMFLAESLLQGVVGTGVGLLMGWLMAKGLFAVMTPMVARYMHLEIGEPIFAPSTWAASILLGLGVTVLAALVPARAAGRVTPMEAMRPQVGEVYERKVGRRAWAGAAVLVVSLALLLTRDNALVGLGAVVFLVGMALVTPAVVTPLASVFGNVVELAFAREGAIARSNLQRNPSRSATTVTAVMLGLASIVAMMTVVASIFAGFMSYLDRSLSADYLVIPQSIVLQQGNVAAGPRLAQDVRHTDGIAAVATLRLSQGKLDGHDVQVIGIDPAAYPRVASFEWNGTASDATISQLASGRWLIANGLFAGQAGLHEGQQVSVETPAGTRTYHVAGVGNDYLNAKLATVYVSQDALARDFHETSDLLVMASRTPASDPAAVRARLDKLVADYPAFKLYESQQWKDEQLATFNATMGIFYALIAALALPSLLALVNTLAISVLARTREIGMLRAVGATRRQVRRMVVAESLLLSLIGTVFAVVAGLWLGYALVVAMASIGWPMPWTFPWGAVLATFVVGVGFGVVAALIPARSAARLDVVDALHHE